MGGLMMWHNAPDCEDRSGATISGREDGGGQGYSVFLSGKVHLCGEYGFSVNDLPGYLYDFQRDLVTWALAKGRAAIFADCGMGKTPMQLVWADRVRQRMNRSILILAPLAVAAQTVREGEKFGIEVIRSRDGAMPTESSIIVTNYEKLDHFDPNDFIGVVCDESSILKNFAGRRRAYITEFMRTLPFRLLCTATASPNDYTELGTSAEALGEMGHADMLGKFFKNQQGNSSSKGRAYGSSPKWRFKKHAEVPFWRWVCSWARAVRKPSDLGYDNAAFILPALSERETIVRARVPREGCLFDLPAKTLEEQREERRRTIPERCEAVVERVSEHSQSLVWCHLNAEGNRLAETIQGAIQVSGGDSDDQKEESLLAFASGDIRVLVTKPRIASFGLNFQQCAHMTFFPSHSYEQYYQGVRRCWRFGQEKSVIVDIVASEGESGVMRNLQRKAQQADAMFSQLVVLMNDPLYLSEASSHPTDVEVPEWLTPAR
jgi:hypothetical protein